MRLGEPAPAGSRSNDARSTPPWWRRLLSGGGWRLAPVALAAGVLALALVTAPELLERGKGAATPQVLLKGSGGPVVEVELLTDEATGPRLVPDGAVVPQGRSLLPRAKIAEPAWLYFVHRGPDDVVQVEPFAPERLPAGLHLPLSGGQPLAYDVSDEPGRHRFGVLAAPEAQDLEQLRLRLGAAKDADEPGLYEIVVEVR